MSYEIYEKKIYLCVQPLYMFYQSQILNNKNPKIFNILTQIHINIKYVLRSGVVRTRGTDLFQLDMEYVLYVKAEDQNSRLDEKRFQSTPEERLSIVGGKRAPQFYMPSYEAEIPENQKNITALD